MYHFPKQIFLDKSMSHFLRQSLLSDYENIDYGRKCSFLHNKSKLFLHFPPTIKYFNLYFFYGRNSPYLAFVPTHNCFLIFLCIFLSCYLRSMLTLLTPFERTVWNLLVFVPHCIYMKKMFSK